MGVKTTISNKGVFSERIVGDDQVVVSVKQSSAERKSLDIKSLGTNATVSQPVTVLTPGAAGVTASLPTVSATNVGTELWVLKSGSNANPVLVSGTQGINGGAWTTVLTANYAALQLLAVSGSGAGFGWQILTQTSASL